MQYGQGWVGTKLTGATGLTVLHYLYYLLQLFYISLDDCVNMQPAKRTEKTLYEKYKLLFFSDCYDFFRSRGRIIGG